MTLTSGCRGRYECGNRRWWKVLVEKASDALVERQRRGAGEFDG